MAHKAGFVNIIGKPNVGKSTLVNQLVGEKIAIATHKAQTTRHRIMGMLNTEDYQIVFSDTPGIIDDPQYQMHHAMMSFVNEAWEDADVLLYVLESGQSIKSSEPIFNRLKELDIPFYILVNKVDLSNQEKLEQYVDQLAEFVPSNTILPISALHDFNIDTLKGLLLQHIPEHPAYYDKEVYTDKTERFLVSEVVREKIFENFKQEIPYSVEVIVSSFKDTDERLFINAEIYVNRKTQKSILIGKQGSALTKVGKQAREELVKHYKKPIRLDLFVKIKEGWRENKNDLKKFGYNS